MDYYIDEITNLKCLDWEDFLENSYNFEKGKIFYIDDILPIINQCRSSFARYVDNNLSELYYRVELILDNDYCNKESEYEKQKLKQEIYELLCALSSIYVDNKSKKGTWKYLDVTMEDLYKYIDKNNLMTLDELFSTELFNKIFKEKDNG